MKFYLARLEKNYPCGNFKLLEYYLQAPSMEEAERHVRRIYPSWTLLSVSLALEGPPR